LTRAVKNISYDMSINITERHYHGFLSRKTMA
jgi:hypothetical protein